MVPNYSIFSLKGTNVAKRSIECMNLSKPFNVGYSVTLRSKSMMEVKSHDFHVILLTRTTRFAPLPHMHLNTTCLTWATRDSMHTTDPRRWVDPPRQGPQPWPKSRNWKLVEAHHPRALRLVNLPMLFPVAGKDCSEEPRNESEHVCTIVLRNHISFGFSGIEKKVIPKPKLAPMTMAICC
jgi:hypothetical protein